MGLAGTGVRRGKLTLAGRAVLAREAQPGAPIWQNAPDHRQNASGFARWVEQNAQAVESFLAGVQ
jgi:hypothetical protein